MIHVFYNDGTIEVIEGQFYDHNYDTAFLVIAADGKDVWDNRASITKIEEFPV